jgi:hypothetical protein
MLSNKINELFGDATIIHKMECKDGQTPLYILFYENMPEKGMLTAVTCGLSDVKHEKWIYGRPELIISLESSSKAWGLTLGYFAAQFRSKLPFSYGTLFTLDEPIAEESEMTGFVLFDQPILDSEYAQINLPDRIVNFYGAYPVYREEINFIENNGLEAFWSNQELDIYSVKRKNLGLNK